ncbi:MAG: hypothetical protein AAGG01_04030, partial [Planctomycetota bacterium]
MLLVLPLAVIAPFAPQSVALEYPFEDQLTRVTRAISDLKGMDVDGDGWVDLVGISSQFQNLVWRRNLGSTQLASASYGAPQPLTPPLDG